MATAIRFGTDPKQVEDDWSDVTPEEADELERACDEADENERNGIGVPVDAVLPGFSARG